jgi:sugar phosphate isomerase/epimerase
MNTPWTYSVTGYQLADKSHEDICRLCVAAGLAGIEGVPPLFAGRDGPEIERIASLYKSQGLSIDSFHLPFTPEDDITSFYETVRRGAVASMKMWIERAALAGARVVIQHPTTARFDVALEGLDNYLRALEKSLAELLPWAQEHGIIVALENMLPPPEGARLGSRPEHFRAFHEKFAHPHLGFCLDTGHALVAGHQNANEFFEAMAPALAAFHLADNAGDRDSHLAPGRGRVNWARHFQNMRSINFTGIACIETPPFDFGPAFSTEAWRNLVKDTETLAAKGSLAPLPGS